jgi:hypothetical protein
MKLNVSNAHREEPLYFEKKDLLQLSSFLKKKLENILLRYKRYIHTVYINRCVHTQ